MAKKKLTQEEFETVKAEFDHLFSEFYPEYSMYRRNGTLEEQFKNSNHDFLNKASDIMKLGKKIGIDIEKYIFEYGTEHNWQ